MPSLVAAHKRLWVDIRGIWWRKDLILRGDNPVSWWRLLQLNADYLPNAKLIWGCSTRYRWAGARSLWLARLHAYPNLLQEAEIVSRWGWQDGECLDRSDKLSRMGQNKAQVGSVGRVE
jgi:hypothetical protein